MSKKKKRKQAKAQAAPNQNATAPTGNNAGGSGLISGRFNLPWHESAIISACNDFAAVANDTSLSEAEKVEKIRTVGANLIGLVLEFNERLAVAASIAGNTLGNVLDAAEKHFGMKPEGNLHPTLKAIIRLSARPDLGPVVTALSIELLDRLANITSVDPAYTGDIDRWMKDNGTSYSSDISGFCEFAQRVEQAIERRSIEIGETTGPNETEPEATLDTTKLIDLLLDFNKGRS